MPGPTRQQLSDIMAFCRHPSRTRDEILSYQTRRLRKVFRHACETVPRYKRLLNEGGVHPDELRSVEDLAALPSFARLDIHALPRTEWMSSQAHSPRLVQHRTSGTSGETFTIWHDRWELQLLRILLLRAFRTLGLRSTDTMVRVWNTAHRHRRDPLRKKITDAIGFYRRHELHWPQPVQPIVEDLCRYRPDVIRSNPSAIKRIFGAVNVFERDHIHPRFLVAEGERVGPDLRRVVREKLGVPVYELYVCTEATLIAWECKDCGQLLVCDDGLVLEVIKTDGRPAGPGEIGEAVITGLHSYAMPIIRYRTGDLVVQGDESCPCGRPFSTLRGVYGRVSDYLTLPGGKRLHPRALTDIILGKAEWVRDHQITQAAERHIVVKVVPSKNPSRDELPELEQALNEHVDHAIRLSVELVSKLQVASSGKLEQYRPWPGVPRVA